MDKKYTLPNMDHRFSIQVVGAESGLIWTGDFLYRRPTLIERSMADVLRAKLNGDLMTIDEDIQAFNEAYANLRYTLKEFPDWWKEAGFGGSLYDANIITEIYNKCTEFEAEWRKKVHGGKAEDVSANEVTATQ